MTTYFNFSQNYIISFGITTNHNKKIKPIIFVSAQILILPQKMIIPNNTLMAHQRALSRLPCTSNLIEKACFP